MKKKTSNEIKISFFPLLIFSQRQLCLQLLDRSDEDKQTKVEKQSILGSDRHRAKTEGEGERTRGGKKKEREVINISSHTFNREKKNAEKKVCCHTHTRT